MASTEITKAVPVLDDLGRPCNFGWAREPLFIYNPDLSLAPQRRITASDRYIIFSPTHLITFEILDGGYLSYIGVSVVSLKDRKRSTRPFAGPFPLGTFELPLDSSGGSIRINQRRVNLDFSAMESGARIIKVDIPEFSYHRRFRGEVVLSPPAGAESMVTHMPWRREREAFWYSRRSPWFIAEGVMQFGSTELVFTRDNAWGIFDWNRGVRPRSDVRFWAAASGISGGRQVGFNAGYSTADSSGGTENAFFLDGKLHKLDQVTFHIPLENWLAPWHFTSNDKRLEMTFVPHQERTDRSRFFFHSLQRRQLCGSFSGKAVLDDGSEIVFTNITGFAERRRTRF